jgi:uncharacterized protein YbjT (DUF2867 family)
MGNSIFVMGATGNVGAEIIRILHTQGEKVIAGTHSGGRSIAGVESRTINMESVSSMAQAFRGSQTLYLMQPLAEQMVSWNSNALAAAKEAGIKHVVRLSGAGADAKGSYAIGRPHGINDEAVRSSGMAFTLLQPVSFMQNYVNFHAASIKSQGAFYSPQGDGKVAFIDVSDLAAVAAKILSKPESHNGKTYVLTGPAAVSNNDVAEVIAKVAGKAVKYVNVPDSAAEDSMKTFGVPIWTIEALTSLNQIIRASYASAVSPEVQNLLGRAPRSFMDFAKVNSKAWA